MENMPGVWDDVRGNVIWDAVKEGAKLMLPFLTGLGIREWLSVNSMLLAWCGAILVTATIAFWDNMPKSKWRKKAHPTIPVVPSSYQIDSLLTAGKSQILSAEARRLRDQLQSLGDRAGREGVDLLRPHSDSIFPDSGQYKYFYKEIADWQRSHDRYVALGHAVSPLEFPAKSASGLFTEVVEALRGEEGSWVGLSSLLVDGACGRAAR